MRLGRNTEGFPHPSIPRLLYISRARHLAPLVSWVSAALSVVFYSVGNNAGTVYGGISRSCLCYDALLLRGLHRQRKPRRQGDSRRKSCVSVSDVVSRAEVSRDIYLFQLPSVSNRHCWGECVINNINAKVSYYTMLLLHNYYAFDQLLNFEACLSWDTHVNVICKKLSHALDWWHGVAQFFRHVSKLKYITHSSRHISTTAA